MRSSKKALKVVIKGDFKGFKESSSILILLAGMKIPTPTKFFKV